MKAVQTVTPLALVLMMASLVRADAAATSLDLVITLENAVLREKGQRNLIVGSRDLLVSVMCEGGSWHDEAMNFAVDYNRAAQKGSITRMGIAGDGLDLDLDIPIEADYTIPGGAGRYRVRLARDGAAIRGTYTGTFSGKPVSGAAHAWAAPAVAQPREKAIGHPRLAFRPADIPGLRQKAQTPQGQAIVRQLRTLLAGWDSSQSAASAAAGYALLFTLSGEPREAAAARTMAKYSLENELFMQNWMVLGAHLRSLALAYDQCSEAWDEPFRVEMASALRRWGDGMLSQYDRNGNGYRIDPASAWQGNARASAALCNLAVLGDAMARSDAEALQLLVIEQPAGFEPGRGVPVVPFVVDNTPAQWIFAGPFPPIKQAQFAAGEERSAGGYLGGLGGPERAFPSVGSQVKWETITRTFQRLPAHHARAEAKGNVFVDVYNASGPLPETTWYYFTVIHNDQERYLSVNIHQRNSTVWLGGQKLAHNQSIWMKPGYIPLLIEVSAGRSRAWDSGMIGTRFWAMEKDYAYSAMNWRREVQLRGHLETDPSIQRNLRVGRLLVGRFLDEHGRDTAGAKAAEFAGGKDAVMQMLLAWRNIAGGDAWHPGRPEMATEGMRHMAGGDDPAAFKQPHEAIYRLVCMP